MHDRNIVAAWVIQEQYSNDVTKASRATGFTIQQLRSWLDGTRIPQTSNVSRLMHHAFEPAFSVIAEFRPIDQTGSLQSVRGQLSAILKGFHKSSGVYAFYDSSGNLLYLGKADGTLLEEAYTQIKATVAKSSFPRGVPQPKTRLGMVRYVSAYRVNKSEFEDYAKHVEALILRIRKPPLNTNSGKLSKAEADAS